MTPVEAVEAIAAHVEASWSATSLEFVAFPGQRFDPPPGKSHVRVLIQGRPPLYTTHGAPGERSTDAFVADLSGKWTVWEAGSSYLDLDQSGRAVVCMNPAGLSQKDAGR